ncbi:Leucyl-tRNA synthetase, mitochondrial, partial [Mortierella sp. AD094]
AATKVSGSAYTLDSIAEDSGTPVPSEDPRVVLPMDESFTNRGGTPLKQIKNWTSSHFLWFLDLQSNSLPFSYAKAIAGMSVDVYIGGVKPVFLHMLYSRFLSKLAWKIGFYGKGPETKSKEGIEPGNSVPFKVLIAQGMVQGRTFKDPNTRASLNHPIWI